MPLALRKCSDRSQPLATVLDDEPSGGLHEWRKAEGDAAGFNLVGFNFCHERHMGLLEYANNIPFVVVGV